MQCFCISNDYYRLDKEWRKNESDGKSSVSSTIRLLLSHLQDATIEQIIKQTRDTTCNLQYTSSNIQNLSATWWLIKLK